MVTPIVRTRKALGERFDWLRDEWEPAFPWKRGSKPVTREDRNWAYFEDIWNGYLATVRRIEAGDEQYAEIYATRLAHYGFIYLRGAW